MAHVKCQLCWRAGTHGDPRRPATRYCVEHRAVDHELLVRPSPVKNPGIPPIRDWRPGKP